MALSQERHFISHGDSVKYLEREALLENGEKEPKTLRSSAYSTSRPYLQISLFSINCRRTITAAIVVLFVVVVLSTWKLFGLTVIKGPHLALPRTRLDLDYVPKREVDIVVSLYKENLDKLSSTLSTISSYLNSTYSITPKITIYCKDEAMTDASLILQHVPMASEIIPLPNRGREGGTYLSHILTNWETLAKHTLFMQAEIHNLGQFMGRLSDYFHPDKTGMLSLGFGGITCELTNCVDIWGWNDTYKHIPQIYSVLYSEAAPPHQMLLSYKGQFVASARRIRATDKAVWEDLLTLLESDGSPWSRKVGPDVSLSRNESAVNTEMGEQAVVDKLDSPVFGYTLERVWGLVLQCADTRIAEECPRLWWRRAWGGSGARLGACQCLDEVEDL
ncbi:hypothetical protein RUND412_001735 [Rhizina undulata]